MQNYGDLFYLPFHINSARLSALLDSGASKSFISSHIVPTLSEYLVPIDVDTLQVSLPNGQKIVSKAAYKLSIKVEKISLDIVAYEIDMK